MADVCMTSSLKSSYLTTNQPYRHTNAVNKKPFDAFVACFSHPVFLSVFKFLSVFFIIPAWLYACIYEGYKTALKFKRDN